MGFLAQPPRGTVPVDAATTGEWYRSPYEGASKSHRVHDTYQEVFFCGRPVTPDPAAKLEFDWWLAVETRPTGHCGTCKKWAAKHDAWRESTAGHRRALEAMVLYDREVTFEELVVIAAEAQTPDWRKAWT